MKCQKTSTSHPPTRDLEQSLEGTHDLQGPPGHHPPTLWRLMYDIVCGLMRVAAGIANYLVKTSHDVDSVVKFCEMCDLLFEYFGAEEY